MSSELSYYEREGERLSKLLDDELLSCLEDVPIKHSDAEGSEAQESAVEDFQERKRPFSKEDRNELVNTIAFYHDIYEHDVRADAQSVRR